MDDVVMEPKRLKVVDLSSLIAERSLAAIRNKIGSREIAFPITLFSDLLSREVHRTQGDRTERLRRFAKKFNAYHGPIYWIELPNLTPGQFGLTVRSLRLYGPELWQEAIEADLPNLERQKEEACAFYRSNVERFGNPSSDLSSADLRLVREWAQNGRNGHEVSMLAARHSVAAFDLDPSLSLASRRRLVLESNGCRATMLMVLHSFRHIGYSGNPPKTKPDEVFAEWNDLVYILMASLCGGLVSEEPWVKRLEAALTPMPGIAASLL